VLIDAKLKERSKTTTGKRGSNMRIASLARLTSCVSTLSLSLMASAASAQVQEKPDATQSDDQAIVVTGSRIARPEIESPNPVSSFSADTIARSGKTDITSLLVDSPALVGSLTNGANAGSNSQNYGDSSGAANVGTSVLNLRNLGSQRTLVLIDGRRQVNAYSGQNSVDINTIPVDLIEGVDILTGGVSAIYGADGVTGVVNFRLKRDFEGLSARIQSGISSRGDAGNRFGSIVAGHNFNGGRGNLTLAYEYNASDRLNQHQRDYLGNPAQNLQLLRNVDNPTLANGGNNLGLPYDKIYSNVSWSDSAPNGAVDIGTFNPDTGATEFQFAPNFDGNGKPYDRGIQIPGSGGRAYNSTSNTPTAGYFGDIQPQLERHNVNLLTSYEFSPALKFFAEGKYVHIDAFTVVQPSFDFFTFLTPDNYYLQQRFGAAAPIGALVSRDNFDLGVNTQTAKRETYRAVLGLSGVLSDGDRSGHLKYEVSYVYGRSRSTVTSGNSRLTDRYYAALDAVVDPATGSPTCRINLPGQTTIDANNYAGVATITGQPVSGAPLSFKPGNCSPITLLGYGQSSEAGRKFVFVDDTTRAYSEQQVLSGSIAGDLGFLFELPGGPVRFAVGGEYRKEKTQSTPSLFAQGGFFDGGNRTAPSGGKFDVKEAYGEVSVPLLSHVRFVEDLSFGGAVRFSDYSTIGSTTTWKVDATYSPIRDITFRGTISRAVRAPNITELFSPAQGVQTFLTDPCDPTNLAEGTQYRSANCSAALRAVGLSPAQIAAFSPSTDPKQSTSQPGVSSGNPNLQAETAKTWTAGIVLRPRFLPRFSFTADWYDIKLNNAINTPDVNEVFKLCVDQATLQNIYCSGFTRSPTTGFINSYRTQTLNVAAFTTSGLEISAAYRLLLPPKLGRFDFRLSGGYLNDLTFLATVGGVPEQQRNRTFRPNYSGNLDLTWLNGPLKINYGLAWQGKTERYTTIQQKAHPNYDPRYIMYKERWEHDVQLSYDVEQRFTIYGGVNNLTDQQPDIAAGFGYPVSALGRYMYVGAKIKLDKLM
jgi:iron complex outermembrane receptor protein